MSDTRSQAVPNLRLKRNRQGEKRDAGHLVEHGLVPVPADPSARSILGDKHLPQVGGGHSRKARHTVAKQQQKARDFLRFPQRALVEVILPTK